MYLAVPRLYLASFEFHHIIIEKYRECTPLVPRLYPASFEFHQILIEKYGECTSLYLACTSPRYFNSAESANRLFVEGLRFWVVTIHFCVVI